MPKAKESVELPIDINLDGVVLVTTIGPGGIHSVVCNRCKETITLTTTANARSLISHRNGSQCKRAALRKHLEFPWRVDTPSLPSLMVPTTDISSTSTNHLFTPPPLDSPTIITLANSLSQLNTSPPSHRPIPDIIVSPPDTVTCSGFSVAWTPGSIWTTYPYHQHIANTSVGWSPVSFNDTTNTIFLRSNGCEEVVPAISSSPCLECQSVARSSEFKSFIQRAAVAPKYHTAWDHLTHEQLVGVMRKMSKELKLLRVKLSNAQRRMKTIESKNDDYRRMMVLIARHEIVGLNRLVSVALRNGASAAGIVIQIQKAIRGLYRSRSGYSERDLDIAFLVKSIGGPRLLYALHKSHGLASESTVRRQRKIPRLLPSVSTPSKAENNTNITTFLDPAIRLPPKPSKSGEIPGNVLMFDGVALETRCRYCPRRNQILGLCREHAGNLETEVTEYKVIEDVRKALFEPSSEEEKVCFGSDATVVAIGPYAGDENYRPVPLVVSASDKTEKWERLKEWVQDFLRDFKTHPFGEKIHGKIYSLASDGDSTYRRAKHEICSTTSLDLDSSIGKLLSSLIGLNHFTSEDGATWTCDPKHIFKRFATLLRSKTGLMVHETIITAIDIIHHLSQLPDLSLEQAINLLDPEDKQNVPKAVSLIQHLLRLEDLPEPLNPSENHKRKAILFLANFLGSFTLPFIDVTLSLGDQLRSLSKFAHLAAALQDQHGSSCLTGALYADTQATIKNIIFTVARLQSIDPEFKLYLLLEGTDRLENLFSDCRTQNHARNFDIDELSSKLSTATLINSAFQRNPDLTQGHRRLNLKAAMGIDHINPESWLGNVEVGNVNLLDVWEEGKRMANDELEKSFGSRARYDFNQMFSAPDHDLLRPNGRYVGVRSTAEDLRSEEENNSLQQDLLHSFPPDIRLPTTTKEQSSTAVLNTANDESEALAQTHSSTSSSSDSFCVSTAAHSSVVSDSPITADILQDDDLFEDTPVGEGLEDQLPDDVQSAQGLANSEPNLSPVDRNGAETEKFSKTLIVGGKEFSKGSLVATLSSKWSKKATMRTLRVKNIAIANLQQKSQLLDLAETSDYDSVPSMKNTDLGAFLTRTDDKICLAVLQISGFRSAANDKQLKLAATLEELGDASKGIKAVGQIVQLDNVGAEEWHWNGHFLSLNSGLKDTPLTKALYVIEVPSTLLQPLRQRVVVGSDGEITWGLDGAELSVMCLDLWEAFNPSVLEARLELMSNIQMLPKISNPESERAFLVPDLPAELVPKPKLDPKLAVKCHICGTMRALNKMREHVGHHILLSMRGYEEENLENEVDIEPCGFCGMEGCLTQLVHRKSGASALTSTCEYHYEQMKFASAAKFSASSPCTNVPIHCPLCPLSLSGQPRTIWKYNTTNHLLICHAQEDPSQPNKFIAPEIPGRLLIDMFITRKEEDKMHIGATATSLYRDENMIPNSDGFEEVHLAVEEEDRQKRARSGTLSQVQSGGKRQRKLN